MKILEWIDIKEKPLRGIDENDFVLVSHPYGVEYIYYQYGSYRYAYKGSAVSSELISSITHWCKPKITAIQSFENL
jgi:hypothetical protein